MVNRKREIMLITLVLTGMLCIPRILLGCGPMTPEAVFVYSVHPDFPLENFARGELGVLQPKYAQSYLYVAYRCLAGIGFDSAEQQVLISLWDDRIDVTENSGKESAVDEWLKSRNEVPGVGKPPKIEVFRVEQGPNYYFEYLNCPDDAFRNAVLTLENRVLEFGTGNPAVLAWVQAQDEVFANCACGNKIPGPVETGTPALLRADRDYQIAAANFYAGNFDEALTLFHQIAQDDASPWRKTALYLAARTLVRKATLSVKNHGVDTAILAQAEDQLNSVLSDPNLKDIHDASCRLLNFIRFRLHPDQRIYELAQAVLKKDSPVLAQDLTDYIRLLDRYKRPYFTAGETVIKQDDMADWIFTFQSSGNEALNHALQRWTETHSFSWLIAVLSKIEANHPKAPELINAAAKVTHDSPAYFSFAYHSVRLMIKTGHKDEARGKLDELLAAKTPPMSASTRNLLLRMRMQLSIDLNEVLKYAQRTPAAVSYNDDNQETPLTTEALEEDSPFRPYVEGRTFFDKDFTSVINGWMPLDMLKESASRPLLPVYLQCRLATAAWTRAILLEKEETALTIASILIDLAPEAKAELNAYMTAKDSKERQAVAVYLILKFPGMRPYLDSGIGRLTALGQLDDYRDNWWCVPETSIHANCPDFLNQDQRTEGANEWKKLTDLGNAPNYLCAKAVEWAKLRPADPRVPEMLHLAVRSTRYGCKDKETIKFSKQAFQLLHTQYPNSDWAEQTKYYYGVD